MKLCIFTIVLDGMPFLKWQYECFKKLECDWHWIVVEGSSSNGGSTQWCNPQEARLSRDGTLEFIDSLKDERLSVLHGAWSSKDKMVNDAAAIAGDIIGDPCVLMQIDVDELYHPKALEKILFLFNEDPTLGAIKMFCRYFVGPNFICEGKNCWSNNTYEWLRAWRFEPGMFFQRHEPPVMNKILGRVMEREEAEKQRLTFDHLAYVRREQAEYKEQFYGYSGLVNQWEALQANTVWPAKLSRFFPFVSGDLPLVRKI